MNNPAVQSTIDGLKALYTIILALAIGEAFKQFVVDRGQKPEERHVQWDRLPALLSFLLLVVPFYHGILRYFFDAYGQPPLPTPYWVWLSLDCFAFAVEAILFFVLSRSLSFLQWRTFYGTVIILLAFDFLWVLVVWVAHPPTIVSWLYLDIVALLGISIVFLVFRGRSLDTTGWRSKQAILPVVLLLLRTGMDYRWNHSFYFPANQAATIIRPDAQNGNMTNKVSKRRIYFAGPLFTQAEWQWNQRLAEELRQRNFDVILPQTVAEPMLKGLKPFDPHALFDMNATAITNAEVVVAILDGADADSGTCWECGYAYRSGRPILAVRTDIRRVSDDSSSSVNLMLSQSCNKELLVPLAQLDDLQGLALKIGQAVEEIFHSLPEQVEPVPKPNRKPIVYIASPYTKGDPEINTQFQCKMFDKILREGKAWPVAPLWAHFQDKSFPRPYRDWIDYDNALMDHYDVCVRLPADVPELHYKQSESSGADAEVKFFRDHGKPVFFSLEDLYKWIDGKP